eukprot:9387643-Prorocentrum_lima.AAC.1
MHAKAGCMPEPGGSCFAALSFLTGVSSKAPLPTRASFKGSGASALEETLNSPTAASCCRV